MRHLANCLPCSLQIMHAMCHVGLLLNFLQKAGRPSMFMLSFNAQGRACLRTVDVPFLFSRTTQSHSSSKVSARDYCSLFPAFCSLSLAGCVAGDGDVSCKGGGVLSSTVGCYGSGLSSFFLGVGFCINQAERGALSSIGPLCPVVWSSSSSVVDILVHVVNLLHHTRA